jgi:hypothetical protein
MKLHLHLIFAFTLSLVTLSSCGDRSDLTDADSTDCSLTDEMLTIEPVCSFDPSLLVDVQFPVQVWVDGELASLDDYTFAYSTRPDFRGSAISVSYSQLPLTVTLTEVDTDCSASAILTTTFWD